MAESGCKGVFLGIESGSPAILKNMNKAATIEKYAKGIELLREQRHPDLRLVHRRLPRRDRRDGQETIDFIRETKPDYYRAQMWYCEPGTPIQNQREKYGINGEGFVWSHSHDGQPRSDGPHRPYVPRRSMSRSGCRSGRSTSGSSRI